MKGMYVSTETIATIISGITLLVSFFAAIGWLIHRTDTRIDRLDQTLTTHIDRLDQKLTTRIDRVDQTLKTRIDSVERELTTRIDSAHR